MVQKIRAAIDAREDPDLLIIARTDAVAVNGLDDALQRAQAYAKAGADVLFIEAPTTIAEIEAIPQAVDRPCLFNYVPGGQSPLLAFARLRALGYALILLPVQTLFAATQAMAEYLWLLKNTDDPMALRTRLIPFSEFTDLIGVSDLLALARHYDTGEWDA